MINIDRIRETGEATHAELEELCDAAEDMNYLHDALNTARAELETMTENYNRAVHEIEEQHKVIRARGEELEALKGKLAGLSEKWRKEQALYPPHDSGQYAAAAVRCCANELDALLEDDEDAG